MKSIAIALMAVGGALACSSCAEDWDYFWHGEPTLTPSYSSGSYSSGYASPQPYSAVESEDQKMRNYRQELDRKINDAVY